MQACAARQRLSFGCGAAGLLGCFAVLAGNIIGILVNEDHNPISETISALAIGPYAWIMDSSLCLFAAALLACALGLYRWHLDGAKWTAATGLLALLGIDVIVIALYNQYAGGQSTGAQVHFFAVCALGILVGLIAFLLVSGLREIAPSWVRFSFWFGLAWVILAPLFSLVPTGWEGAYERFLGLLLISWIAALSWLLLQRQEKDFAGG